jgi:dipeptidase E
VNRRLMLHAGGDISSAGDEIVEHFRGVRRAVMVPWAVKDHDRVVTRFNDRFASRGLEVTGLHTVPNPAASLAEADAIVVSGGNSFRLVAALHRFHMIDTVRSAIVGGVPYFGGSAGANVASPTIRTTNDMPIVQPPSFAAFGLVPFQINPHYIDPPAPEARIGETREERLQEFLEENHVTVVALREESWLMVNDMTMSLHGTGGALILRRGAAPEPVAGGADLSPLLNETPRYDA